MENAPERLKAYAATWPETAQDALWVCRKLFHTIAAEVDAGPLDETLKWGQPSWRPSKPRTGSTLRMDWDASTPFHLSVYVDCKTDLASRMRDIYPDLPLNDGQRHLAFDLTTPLPEQALAHLAEMTFTYHRTARRKRQ